MTTVHDQAFPTAEHGETGMSKRELMAAIIAAGLCQSTRITAGLCQSTRTGIVHTAIAITDELLQQLHEPAHTGD